VAAPETYYELFRGLGAADAEWLLAGAVALTLHGVPRLTDDVDLLVPAGGDALARLRALLGSWGYAEAPAGPGGSAGEARRFVHPTSPIAAIDLVPLPDAEFAALAARAALFRLVDAPLRTVSLEDLRRRKGSSAIPQDREDAASIDILASVRRGEAGDPGDVRRTQIVKFGRWHAENRCEWLLAGNRLRRGLPPEARPAGDARFRPRRLWK
jgi:hypothetical protein